MRERWCKICTGWHEVGKTPHNCLPEVMGVRGDYDAPMLIRDEMDPTQSMHSGKYYTSKHKLRQEYKDHGLIECGDDKSVVNPKPFQRKKVTREDVRPAVSRALSKAGFGA